MDIAALEKLLDGPRDNAMLRLTLAKQLHASDRTEAAIEHLKTAVAKQPDYSAAWKLLGKCLAQTGQIEAARQAYEQGLIAAQANGDKQSEKEITVFLRRLNK